MPNRFYMPPTDPGYAELGRALGGGFESGVSSLMAKRERDRLQQERAIRQDIEDQRYEAEQEFRRRAAGYFDASDVFDTQLSGGGSVRETATAVPIAQALGPGAAAQDIAGQVTLLGREFVAAPVTEEEVLRPEFSPDPALSQIAGAVGINLDPVRTGDSVYVPSRDPRLLQQLAQAAVTMRGQDAASERAVMQAENAMMRTLISALFAGQRTDAQQAGATERARIAAGSRGQTTKSPEQVRQEKVGRLVKELFESFKASDNGTIARLWAVQGNKARVDQAFNRWFTSFGEGELRRRAAAEGLDFEEVRKILADHAGDPESYREE